MSDNPLKKYMRTPKIYVKLPSQGVYYDNSVLELTDATQEIGVLPMTANDELILQTPDALLNGESLENVIKSCCPTVKDVKKLTTNDVDTLMLAIRYASYGDKLIYKSDCPKCNHENEYTISIRTMLDHLTYLDPPYAVEIKKGLKVYVRPYSFNTNVKTVLQTIEIQRILKQVSSDTTEDDVEKIISDYKDSFNKAAAIGVDLILDGIEKVEIIEEGSKLPITDREQIHEWILDVDRKTADTLRNKIKELNEIGPLKELDVTCEECNHEWKLDIEFNPVDFFT